MTFYAQECDKHKCFQVKGPVVQVFRVSLIIYFIFKKIWDGRGGGGLLGSIFVLFSIEQG